MDVRSLLRKSLICIWKITANMKYWCLVFILTAFSCQSQELDDNTMSVDGNTEASVTEVTVSGSDGSYSFAVTISSPDTGCEQYADWWEVVSEEGELLHRRILAHSHVNEQPFTRSGSALDIAENQLVVIRMHMNNTGYSSQGMKGTIEDGFSSFSISEDFGQDLEEVEPLPSGCAF